LKIISIFGKKEMEFEVEGTLEEIKKLKDEFDGVRI